MQIAVLSLISLLLTAVAWVYLSFGSLKEQGVSIKNIASVFLAHKKKDSILKSIIHAAVHKDLRLKVPMSLKNKYKGRFTVPVHGRDNASGVIYIKD